MRILAKPVNLNPAEQSLENYIAAVNAYAEQQVKRGEKTEFLSRANAKDTFRKMIRAAVALVNPANVHHNEAYNAFKDQLGRPGHDNQAFTLLEEAGRAYLKNAQSFAQVVAKNTGVDIKDAIEVAYNSLAGNPVFDHFANLNALSDQLYQERAFIENFQSSGDALALPTEAGGTNTDRSRFRLPTEQVVGSPKTYQGNINPASHMQDDENRLQINLFNEFKDAKTLEHVFSITQDQRNQTLGYAEAVSPALAGFILQNRYFKAAQEHLMKLAEMEFVDGMKPSADFTPNVGGSYGVLTDAIHLALSDWNTATPAVATSADWAANPTRLIQKIQNYNFTPITPAGQLPSNLDPSLMYKDIVRLAALAAQQNVNYQQQRWSLFVPTTWYGIAMQYPGTMTVGGQGTFNKQLDEMVKTATSGLINRIEIIPSNLMNYRARNFYGSTVNAFNYMFFVAQGAASGKKPVVMPGQTAAPVISSENVSASIMNFRTQWLFGGPMVIQYGGAYLMEFSRADAPA